MSNPHTAETVINFALCSVLRKKHPLWSNKLSAEQSQVLHGHSRKVPDIVLSSTDCAPVIVETEFLPASTVETDAKSRLLKTLSTNNHPIENVIALRIPEKLKTTSQDKLENEINNSTFSYCIFSAQDSGKFYRWPSVGWVSGNVDDVANCIESVSLTESLIAQSTDVLKSGVKRAAAILSTASEDVQRNIGNQLGQTPGEQTNRMASAIIANAMIFHSRVEGQQNVPTLNSLELELPHITNQSGLTMLNVVKCWEWITIDVNYWPIFKIASDLLRDIPTIQATRILNEIYEMSNKLSLMGATRLTDLSGRMFQKLITDRKFLATFYTLPVSALFLAEILIRRLNIDWADDDSVTALMVADFACGTGTLIGALYRSIMVRYRRAGKDDSTIHSDMLEKALYAFDIMPAATHLTASTLSNLHPAAPFGTTRIVTMPYGKDSSQAAYIGSLELIKEEQVKSLLSLGRHQLIGQKLNGDFEYSNESAELIINSTIDHQVDMLHESLDIVIMNPPFTRPTNHAVANVPIPSFAGFTTSKEEQKEMSSRLKTLRKTLDQPAGHGNAGLASNFIDLAHVKLKPGGLLGLVLPATFTAGSSWENARQLLEDHYENLTVVSITNVKPTEAAFSADTNMAEVLVIATKKQCQHGKHSKSSSSSSRYQFVNLRHRPPNYVEAYELARCIHQNCEQLDFGRVLVGSDDSNGTFLNMPYFDSAFSGLMEPNLAKFMVSLSHGNFLSTRTNEVFQIPVVELGSLGTRGIGHRDLTGKTGNQPRGPFDRIPLVPGGIPTFPALWSHNSRRERTFYVEPDCELQIRQGMDFQSAQVWKKYATRLHMNLDFGLNSQCLVACLTDEKALGGRSWPNFVLDNLGYEKIAVLWFNSTVGLMSHWWVGSKQHIGRSIITISRLSTLLMLNPHDFDEEKISKSEEIFESFSKVEFLRASDSYKDPNRIALDKALFVELLGVPQHIMDEFDIIRKQWCAEPKVHGGIRKS